MGPNIEKNGPLTGIRILDLADERASFCSKLLADMGADVIKVEKPGGDSSRRIGPFLSNSAHPERSLFFYHNNANKRGITLNLEQDAGRDIFRKLIKSSDVAVETFPPGYLEELGLSFEHLRETNPTLILVSVTGFGQTGPRRQYQSCDLVASAFGGQTYVSGLPSTPPLKPFGEQSYYTASLVAAVGVLLALRKRTRSGKGEHVDISMQEAVAATLEHMLVRYCYDHVIPRRQGNRHWNNGFCILPCKNGHMLVSLFQQWETLVEWLANEGMAEDLADEKWKDEDYRLHNVNHVIEVLGQWSCTHTTEELFKLGQLMRFAWAPVQSPRDVLNSPQLTARGFFINVNHPEAGTVMKYPGSPYKTVWAILERRKRAPLIGEDNEKVYRHELGLTRKELQKLTSMNII